jgi:acid phosphatase
LNHQYLICGCAPEYPNADTSPASGTITVLDKDSNGNWLPSLTTKEDSPPSAMENVPTFVNSSNLTPKEYFGDGKFHAVNTMQPPYQPSGTPPPADDATKLFADIAAASTPGFASTLPPQSAPTIGDRMNAKGVSWKWYAGAWNKTNEIATTTHTFPSYKPGEGPNFQYHHQPFNYYAAFDPKDHADARQEHLKDYDDLVADIAAGTLPEVSFYKPEGDLNQHAGYATLDAGDKHIADLVSKIEASPEFESTVVIVTYDENGGFWDHAAPPAGDKLGPGTRIPAIIIAPFAKKGTVDKTVYDTGSIMRLINRRFDLEPLPGIASRTGFGDLTNALDL